MAVKLETMWSALRHALVSLSVVVAWSACSEKSTNDSRADVDAEVHASGWSRAELCDGSERLRLSYMRLGGSLLQRGADVLQGPGLPYLMLDGRCTLFVRSDTWSPVRSFTLDSADFQQLSVALRMKTWQSRERYYCLDIADGPTQTFSAPGVVWEVIPFHMPACSESESDLAGTVQAYIDSVSARGDVLNGAVRYSLVAFTGRDFGTTFRGAAGWPLGLPADYVTTDALPDRLAAGADASTLRQLRDRYLSGEIGSLDDSLIPIEQDDGQRYALRLRDVAPFETASGMLPNAQ